MKYEKRLWHVFDFGARYHIYEQVRFFWFFKVWERVSEPLSLDQANKALEELNGEGVGCDR